MEKGEVAILAVQFGALLVVVLVVGNVLPGGSVEAPPTISNVYWGSPGSSVAIPTGGTLRATTNQSSIYVYFHMGGGATVASTSASRFCTDPSGKAGESTTYVTIPFMYDTARGENFLVITPTTQRSGFSCVYAVQITDTLQQIVKWTGTVHIA